jgi:hypothetical protein
MFKELAWRLPLGARMMNERKLNRNRQWAARDGKSTYIARS